MKRNCLALLLTLAVALPNLGSANPPMPPGHPTLPTDTAYVKSIDGVINALFESISGPRGQDRDWVKFRTLFSPDARLFPTRLVHEKSIVGMMTPEQFVESESKYLKSAGYFEKPVNIKIEQFGHIAHVRSIYEARRRAEDEKPYTRGIYSIQLVETEGRWWILNMLWQPEDQLNPIPEEYLKP